MDILALNNKMIAEEKYNISDMRQMTKIASLVNPNDFDLYLILCALCNYNIENLDEARKLRMEYYKKTSTSGIDYSHTEEDYQSLKTSLVCKNANRTNKFGLYEYEINTNDRDLVSDLWEYKNKDCLKYVDSKTYPNKIVISINREQINNFKRMLDKLSISYDAKDLENGLFYINESKKKLIDISKLDLPFKPYDFQIEDAETVLKKKRMLLGHDMGCGKTLISILIGESLKMRKLVVCPESLRLNWEKEIKQTNNSADVQILYCNETFHYGKDWTIVGYGTVSKFLPNLIKTFKCMFVDEAHNCKAVNNWGKATSKRAESVLELANSVEYCYLLTGTPMPSHNKDLYNIFKMLKCERFDFNSKWAFLNFANKFCDPKETRWGKDYTGSSNTEELHDLLRKLMVRRLKKEVLPDLHKQRQFIPIKAKFKKDYLDIEKRVYEPNPTDTYMGLAMTGRQMLSQYKIDSAIELAESLLNADESVVIAINFVETANKLKEHFKDKACEIRGGMTDKEKQKSIEDFQAKKKQVCILNLEAGGVGVTLTAAHTMIVIDYAWLPSDMTQVEDRICRNGQEDDCMIYYVYCENSLFDNLFIDMLSEKSANIDTVVDNSSNTYDISSMKSDKKSDKTETFIGKLKELVDKK